MTLPPLFWTKFERIASKNNLFRIVELLVNNSVALDQTDNEGNTALITALRYKRLQIANHFIKNSANVDIQNKFGQTALFFILRLDPSRYSGEVSKVGFSPMYESLNVIKQNKSKLPGRYLLCRYVKLLT